MHLIGFIIWMRRYVTIQNTTKTRHQVKNFTVLVVYDCQVRCCNLVRYRLLPIVFLYCSEIFYCKHITWFLKLTSNFLSISTLTLLYKRSVRTHLNLHFFSLSLSLSVSLSLSLTLGINKHCLSQTSVYELFVPRSVVPSVGTEMFTNIFPLCTCKSVRHYNNLIFCFHWSCIYVTFFSKHHLFIIHKLYLNSLSQKNCYFLQKFLRLYVLTYLSQPLSKCDLNSVCKL